MKGFGRRWGGLATAAMAAVVAAQSTPPVAPESAAPPKEEALTGTPAYDILPLDGTSQGIALRFGNVIPGSERVMLDGAVLTAGTDYALDAEAGVIYLKRAARTGSTVSANYRYSATPVAGVKPTGIGKFRFDLTPNGRVGLFGGLGLTERTKDGGVMRANSFGMRNSFSMAGGTLSGAYVLAERKRVVAQAGFSMDPNAKAGDASGEEGASQFLVQNFTGKSLGGQIVAEYQDISQNFASFGQAVDAGLDPALVARLQAERGLQRMGYGIKDAKVGGIGFSSNFRTVKDDAGSIDWRSYGISVGGLKLDYTGRTVSAGFNRFKDIREEDREQLLRERGMSRQNLVGEWAMKGAKLGFEALSIADDGAGKSIERREIRLDTSKLKMAFGDQEVAKGFGRFDSLLGDERHRYGREAGLSRQWASLDATVGGAALALKESRLSGEVGSFVARDGELKGKNWSLTHVSRGNRDGFGSLSAMAENEMDSHIKSIAGMYGPSVGTRPEDRGAFARTGRLERTSTRLEMTPSKAFRFAVGRTELTGEKAGATIDTVSVSAGRFSADYRKQTMGQGFAEFDSLMEFERNALGRVSGLGRTDFAARFDHKKATAFRFSQTEAGDARGGMKRSSAAYDDGKLSLAFNAREVDSGFETATAMLDPEREMLAGLRGFKQRDVRMRWTALPGMQMELFRFDAANAATGEDRLAENLSFGWSPRAGTSIGFVQNRVGSTDRDGAIFGQRYSRFDLKHDFGRYGNLAYAEESVDNEGRENRAPDLRRRFLAYEAKIGGRTRVRTEQTRTAFSDGGKEDISSNTLATEINRRMGVSVTDTDIDRQGDDRDERKRNYGVWYDLGKGLRITWGYARHLNGDASTGSSTVGLASNVRPDMTAEQVRDMQTARVGALNVGGAYGANSWDADSRTQSFANVGFSTARKLNFGPFRDVDFRFAYDAAADRTAWSRENRFGGISGKFLGLTFGYDYRGQMHANGERGIDRAFVLKTDPDQKKALRANLAYKVRTLPQDQQVMIRDFDVTLRLAKNLEVTHQLQTNPEVFRSDAFLGSVPQAARAARWRLDGTGNSNFLIGATWEQLANDLDRRSATTGGVNLTLFGRSGSPLKLFYGMEEQFGQGIQRRIIQRYSLRFDQKAGPNQAFSIFMGNVSYEHSLIEGVGRNNFTVRLDYQLRF